jgi:SAM-dependent methyltransferase
MDLKEEEILGEAIDEHWYYRAKARVLEKMLPAEFGRTVMDVGAGSGFFSKHLAYRGLVDRAVCVDVGYDGERRERVGDAEIVFTPQARSCDAGVALFMDVLEHVEDDVALLASYRKLLSPQATAIITVPAFAFLWSGHDVFLGHYRRYTLDTLRSTIERAGYRVIRLHYFYGLVFPAAVATRLLSPNRMEPRSHLKRHAATTNALLHALCVVEIPLMHLNKVAGLSVCAACRPA